MDAYDLRNHTRMGVVHAVDDAGAAQTVTVETNDGAVHSGVEVQQPFGVASVPPADGALAVVVAIGGDPGQLVALPVGNPSGRFGNLKPGEAAIYGSDGSRVHIRQGGTIEVWATNVIVNTPTLTIQAPSGDADVLIKGNLVVTKDISDWNGVHSTLGTLRADYNTHTHQVPGVQAGGSTVSTVAPAPQDT